MLKRPTSLPTLFKRESVLNVTLAKNKFQMFFLFAHIFFLHNETQQFGNKMPRAHTDNWY